MRIIKNGIYELPQNVPDPEYTFTGLQFVTAQEIDEITRNAIMHQYIGTTQ